MKSAINKDMTARSRVLSTLNDRETQIVLEQINMTGKYMTVSDCLRNDYVYNKDTSKYTCSTEQNTSDTKSSFKSLNFGD